MVVQSPSSVSASGVVFVDLFLSVLVFILVSLCAYLLTWSVEKIILKQLEACSDVSFFFYCFLEEVGKRERRKETNIKFSHSFLTSLVGSCTCPERGWDAALARPAAQPGHPVPSFHRGFLFASRHPRPS